MPKVFPHLRIHGENEEEEARAALYVKRGMDELFRTESVQKLMGAPIYARTLQLESEGITIYTSINGGVKTIDITAVVPPIEPVEKEIIPEKPKPFAGCIPGFILYESYPSAHSIPLDYPEFKGFLLGLDRNTGGWKQYPLADEVRGSPNGGWYHLDKIYPTLNQKEDHSSCDLITWWGNPSSMCHDSVYSWGADFTSGERVLLSKNFYYAGVRYTTPIRVLGACLLPDGDKNYFYMIGYEHQGNAFLTDGADEEIWRKDASKPSHATNDWELIGTVPFTDYSDFDPLSYWPIPISTAYIDEEGVAWLTKSVDRGSIQLRINLKTGAHTEVDGGATLDWSMASSWDYTHEGSPGNTSIPVVDLDFESRNALLNGEQYVFTMGGLEARYDLFVKVNHQDTWSLTSTNKSITKYEDAKYQACYNGPFNPYYFNEYTRNANVTQDTKVVLIIRKNGKDFWEGPLWEAHVGYSSAFDSGPLTYTGPIRTVGDPSFPSPTDLGCLTGTDLGQSTSWSLPSLTVSSSSPVFPINQRNYIFLHPHMLELTTWFERDIILDGSSDTDATGVLSFMRGKLEGDVLLQWTGAQSLGADDLFLTANRGKRQIAGGGFGSGSVAESGKTSAVYRDSPFGVHGRPEFVTKLINDGGFGGVSSGFNLPVKWFASVGMHTNFGGNRGADSYFLRPYSGYSHAAQVEPDRVYLPQYAAVHRPVEENGPWSYVACLQNIIDAEPSQAIIDAKVSYLGSFDFGDWYSEMTEILSAAMRIEDGLTLNPLAWVESNSRSAWDNGHSYAVGELVWDNELEPARNDVWRCTSAHTAGSTNRPAVGEFADTVWTLHEPQVTTFSNVLTEDDIQRLTGQEHNDTTEIGIL